MITLQPRTKEALMADINLLVEFGWKRDMTPPDENDLFYSKNGKTAIVFKTTIQEEFENKPMLKRYMFNENGDALPTEHANLLPF